MTLIGSGWAWQRPGSTLMASPAHLLTVDGDGANGEDCYCSPLSQKGRNQTEVSRDVHYTDFCDHLQKHLSSFLTQGFSIRKEKGELANRLSH